MSIIPYSNNRHIVLRHRDSVVLYDTQSKEFNVSSQRARDLLQCPYCHQPINRDNGTAMHDAEAPGSSQPFDTAGFVSPEYFRMLQERDSGTDQSANPPSPQRRLVEAFGPEAVASPSTVPPLSYGAQQQTGSGATPSATGISAKSFSQGYFERFFVMERELGRGGKGVVLLVTHILDQVDLGQYACKRVPVGNDHAWLINALNEVRLLVHLSHQNLVYYKHVWLEEMQIAKFGPSVPGVFILQQYCNRGDLHHHLIRSISEEEQSAKNLKQRARRTSKTQHEPVHDFEARRLRFDEIHSFFKDIASGLNHLHVNGYIHRDLKPSNCLLHDDGQGLKVLVSDFGEVQNQSDTRQSTGATGTVSYCAPEVLRIDPTTGALGNFTTKSDIFSLGMILYFLCFARLPYRNADLLNEENEDVDLLKNEIADWSGLHEERKLRPDLPEQLYTFLRRLLSLNPADRPSTDEILLAIKTGAGLDSISDSRPNRTAHRFDDLSASSRISPVDSPRPSTPARRDLNSQMPFGGIRRQDSPGAASQLSRRSMANEIKTTGSLLSRETSVAENERLEHMNRKASRISGRRELPALPEPPRSILSLSNLYDQRRRLDSFRDAFFISNPKFAIFVLKVMSLYLSCSPVAVRPVYMYSLLALASLDFLFLPYGHQTSFVASSLLMLIHFALLITHTLTRRDFLCIREGQSAGDWRSSDR